MESRIGNGPILVLSEKTMGNNESMMNGTRNPVILIAPQNHPVLFQVLRGLLPSSQLRPFHDSPQSSDLVLVPGTGKKLRTPANLDLIFV